MTYPPHTPFDKKEEKARTIIDPENIKTTLQKRKKGAQTAPIPTRRKSGKE